MLPVRVVVYKAGVPQLGHCVLLSAAYW